MSILSANSELPTRTLTFVFTDVEGSTRLWELAPAAMQEAMARHDALIEGQVARNSGNLVRPRGEGDSRFAVFARATDAVAASRDIQQSLAAQPWPTLTPLRVRMALHTGEADLRAGDYYGSDVNRCARLRAIAHGGQTLLSQSTHDLIRDALPENVSLRDLGEHRLKDLQRPEHVYQLDMIGLAATFPPLQSLDAFPNNLPVQLTSFVGRERELSEVKQLLTTTHLLTVTGPGGTGKTRLSLQFGAEILEAFTDGVWLVELAPLANPMLVAQTVASTLGVREQPPRSILDALVDYVRAKNLLLILDNCEHLIDACAQLANTLLRAAPHLKILASSREALGIAGETSYRVPSLSLPDPRQISNLDALSQNDCVHLFVDRATAVSPRFRLTEKNASAIVDICQRLDGIPLAIELAAARTKVFPPEQIAVRLDDRFRLLTGGSRAALERHQTLRALIDWSYDLLSDAERVLLRRLSVFAGGFSFDAAQAVCSEGLGDQVLDLLTHLVDKSLVVVEEQEGEARYRLLETIRQYARDKLFESGEAEQARDRHLEFFIRFAERAEPKLRSAEQLAWLERVETEHDNLRTALAWSLESGKGNRALELVGAIYYFWESRGYWSEGQKWLDEALALDERKQQQRASGSVTYTLNPTERARQAKALYGAGRLRFGTLSGLDASRTTVEESLRLWRELGDKWWMAVCLEHIGFMLIVEGNVETARVRLEEGVSLARQVEASWPLALCLVRLASPLIRTDLTAAHLILEEGVPLARRVGDKNLLSLGLIQLATSCLMEGNLTEAASVAAEALADARAIGSLSYIFLSLFYLVLIGCLEGDPAKAKAYSFELMALSRETGAPQAAGFVLIAFGLVASFGEHPERGVRLLAAANAWAGQIGIKLSAWGGPIEKAYKQGLEAARAQLDPAAFEAAQLEGSALTPEQAIALATEDESEDAQL